MSRISRRIKSGGAVLPILILSFFVVFTSLSRGFGDSIENMFDGVMWMSRLFVSWAWYQ